MLGHLLCPSHLGPPSYLGQPAGIFHIPSYGLVGALIPVAERQKKKKGENKVSTHFENYFINPTRQLEQE